MISSIKLLIFLKNWKKTIFRLNKTTNYNSFSALNSEAIRLENNKTESIEGKDKSKRKENLKTRNKKSKGVRMKAIKIVLSIVLLFFVQWTPLWIFELYKSVKNGYIENIHLINSIISLASYSNSISNPLLYIMITVSFRDFLSEIYKFLRSKCFQSK